MKTQNSLVIGVDPGVNNLGWCITLPDGELAQWGLLTETLVDLKTTDDIKTFRKNMIGLITTLNSITRKKYLPDFVMERYMPRGMRRGNQVERINIIIGYLLGMVSYRRAFMVQASTWKNRREREYTLVENSTVPDHMVDTYTLTLYYLEKVRDVLSTRDVKRRLRDVRETDWGWKKKKGVWIQGRVESK